MFGAPPVIRPEVFVQIPESLWKTGRHMSILEGPSFDRAGNLYVVNVSYGQVFRISPNGDVALIAEYDGEPNGLKIHRFGRRLDVRQKHEVDRLVELALDRLQRNDAILHHCCRHPSDHAQPIGPLPREIEPGFEPRQGSKACSFGDGVPRGSVRQQIEPPTGFRNGRDHNR